ncbi:MAG: 4Fe-4S binding protein [Treponemataceae bacterium]|nr:4Fe-4S binding protein [Treponemataceae bacterium]
MVFSAEEKDFLNNLIEPYDSDNGLCAVVKCSPDRDNHTNLLEHSEMTDCRLFSEIYGKEQFCKWGCLGYGTCVTFCPQQAIIIKNGTAVITESCNGCGACVDHCPQHIIELIPREKEYFVQCSLPEDETCDNCSVSCTSCRGCRKEETLTLEIAKKCPRKCIKKITNPFSKGFKL